MIIIGAKGHAKDLLTVIEENDYENNICFFDDVSTPVEQYFLNKYKIIHSLSEINFNKKLDFVTGIGNPKLRRLISEKFISLGANYKTLVSKKAILGNHKVVICMGTTIMQNVFISNNVYVGKGTLVNVGAQLHHDVIVGEYCDISPKATLLGNTSIGNNCIIGAGATLLPNVKLGDNVIVGAGATVTKNFLKPTVLIGESAKPLNY